MSGRANHGDDLRAGLGGRDRSRPVFVDVSARDDDVEQRRRQLRQALEARSSLIALRVDSRERGFDVRPQRAARRGFRCLSELLERVAPQRHRLAERCGVETRLGQRLAECERNAVATLGRGLRVDDRVGDGDFLGRDAVDAQQPQHRALHGNGRVRGNERLDGRDDGGG